MFFQPVNSNSWWDNTDCFTNFKGLSYRAIFSYFVISRYFFCFVIQRNFSALSYWAIFSALLYRAIFSALSYRAIFYAVSYKAIFLLYPTELFFLLCHTELFFLLCHTALLFISWSISQRERKLWIQSRCWPGERWVPPGYSWPRHAWWVVLHTTQIKL